MAKTLIPIERSRVPEGLARLLSDDPAQLLLHAVETAQDGTDYRKVARVLKQIKKRENKVGWIHASDTIHHCDRVLAARLLGYKLPGKKPDSKLWRIFENGTFMHLRWQNVFMSLPKPFEVEVAKILRRWPIIGEADVAVRHPKLGYWLVELKSMNTGQYRMLKAPVLNHGEQINLYMGLAGGRYGGQVWYEDKNNQDPKAYVAPLQRAAFANLVERIDALVEMVFRGRLPRACGECEYDEFVGDLKWDDRRLEKAGKERDKWQETKLTAL